MFPVLPIAMHCRLSSQLKTGQRISWGFEWKSSSCTSSPSPLSVELPWVPLSNDVFWLYTQHSSMIRSQFWSQWNSQNAREGGKVFEEKRRELPAHGSDNRKNFCRKIFVTPLWERKGILPAHGSCCEVGSLVQGEAPSARSSWHRERNATQRGTFGFNMTLILVDELSECLWTRLQRWRMQQLTL